MSTRPLGFSPEAIAEVRYEEKLGKLFGVNISGYAEGKNLLVAQKNEGRQAGLSTPLQGRVSTYLQASCFFAQTVFQALVALVREVALVALSLLPAIFSSQARGTFEVHAKLLLSDIAALPIGMVGVISPHVATFLASGAMKLFEALFLPAKDDLPKGAKDWLEGCRSFGETPSQRHVYTVLLSMQEKMNALEDKIDAAEGEEETALRKQADELLQRMVDYTYLNRELVEGFEQHKEFHRFVTGFKGVAGFESYSPSDEVQAILNEREAAKAASQ